MKLSGNYRGAGVPKKDFARRHDTILRYSKKIDSHYFNPDPARQPYAAATVERFQHYIGNVRDGVDYGQQELNPKGKHPDDVITDIQPIAPSAKARKKFPTQKPLNLYERIIETSSSKGEIVFDPFAGCATTCVAAERLGRQWVGIDIWDKAEEIVLGRMEELGLIAQKYTRRANKERQTLLFSEDLHFTSDIPVRTDDGEEAVPFLLTKKRVVEPKDEFSNNAEKREFLLEQNGSKCQGCDRKFNDPRYLELDHNRPRSDGGWNHIDNRILLCGPCNKLKSNIYTLSGLRRQNKKLGYMAN